MKIGITNGAYYSREKDFFDYAKMRKHGYECADYQQLASMESKLYKLADKEFKETLLSHKTDAEKNGITFSQVHAPFLIFEANEEQRKELAEYTKRAIEGTKLLGSKHLVVHTIRPHKWNEEEKNAEESYKINIDFFREISEYALNKDVCICVENLPFKNHSLSKTSEVIRLVDEVNMPNIFVCLDTGHSLICDENIKETVCLLGKRLKVLHIHDNRKNGDTHTLPYTGDMDWEGFKQGLKEINFDGCISAETEVKHSCPEFIRDRMMICLADTLKYFGGIE